MKNMFEFRKTLGSHLNEFMNLCGTIRKIDSGVRDMEETSDFEKLNNDTRVKMYKAYFLAVESLCREMDHRRMELIKLFADVTKMVIEAENEQR